MATHSSTLAWRVSWMEEPGRLQSMGSWRVRHYWATSLLLFTFMHWRRNWQPTPVFLPGESLGQRGLVGCCLWELHRVGHHWSDLATAAAESIQWGQCLHILWLCKLYCSAFSSARIRLSSLWYAVSHMHLSSFQIPKSYLLFYL